MLLNTNKAKCRELFEDDYIFIINKYFCTKFLYKQYKLLKNKKRLFSLQKAFATKSSTKNMQHLSYKPYVSIDDINDFFGTKKSTTGNKSKEIRDLLKLDYWDSEFSTKKMANSNPFANFVMVDGFMTPVGGLPKEYQEMVRQVRADGGSISFSTKKYQP